MAELQPMLTRRVFVGCASAVGLMLPGMSWGAQREDWPGVRAIVQDYVRSGKLAGAVAAMGLGQAPLTEIAAGHRSLGMGGAIDADSLFRIYSMTKPITGMAAMMLVDEGRIGLDQPLGDILPVFTEMQVQRTPDGPVEDVVPAERPITIRHLLTHTAGLGYSTEQKGPLKQAYERAGLVPGMVSRFNVRGLSMPEPAGSLATFADRLAAMPLVHQPGTKWSYSVGLDLIGRVIEVVSGKPFDKFLQERLFGPLGMTSTFFRVPDRDAARLTSNHAVMDGLLIPIDPASVSRFLDEPPFPFGGSGLISSPRDYDRFLRMLLGHGAFDGRRVMSEAAVRLGTSDLLPSGIDTKGTYAMGGGFGAGGRAGIGAEAGTFGWGGAAGTIAFADLKRGWRGGFYAQYMPTDAYPIHRKFPEIAMQDAIAIQSGAAA